MPPRERTRRADHWETTADERELLADDRDRLADERDLLADARDARADGFQRELDLREAGTRAEPGDDADDQAALDRAAAAVRRAEARLERARAAHDRLVAAQARQEAGRQRRHAAEAAAATEDPDEAAWLAERRDFVAASRDDLADARDRLADARDATADQREREADARERAELVRDRRVTARQRREPGPVDQARQRAADGHDRDEARSLREVAADRRAQDAAQWGPQPYGPLLTTGFAVLVQRVFGSDRPQGTLSVVLDYAVASVAGCERAGLTLGREGQPTRHLASDEAVARLDAAQLTVGVGPVAEALSTRRPVHAPDLTDQRRWPGVAAVAAELGLRSAVCCPLTHQPDGDAWTVLGTFQMYGSRPDVFDTEAEQFALVLAAMAAGAVATARGREELDLREAALHRSLSTRDLIGQAKGILMERERLSAGDAFDVLRRASQRLNRKVVDVAGYLAETGQLPL